MIEFALENDKLYIQTSEKEEGRPCDLLVLPLSDAIRLMDFLNKEINARLAELEADAEYQAMQEAEYAEYEAMMIAEAEAQAQAEADMDAELAYEHECGGEY